MFDLYFTRSIPTESAPLCTQFVNADSLTGFFGGEGSGRRVGEGGGFRALKWPTRINYGSQ